MTILENIEINLDLEMVRRKLHLKTDNQKSEVDRLAETVQRLIEPQALYEVCYIEEKSEDSVVVGGMRLSSRVLRKNLEQAERIFPFVVTLGAKFGEIQNKCDDMLENYYLDFIGNLALNAGRKQLAAHLRSRFALDKISSMAPGSLSDWPIEEQKPLFKLLGDVDAAIGVKLTPSLLMIPAKSVSGFYFPAETSFYSCQLCPRERCDSRKAAYNQTLVDEYGIDH